MITVQFRAWQGGCGSGIPERYVLPRPTPPRAKSGVTRSGIVAFDKSTAFLSRGKAFQALLPRQRLADLSKSTMSWSK